MKNILVEPTGKSYSPGIWAMIKYFDQRPELGIKFHDASKLKHYQLNDFDGVWKSMGTHFSKVNGLPLIHEYPSLSTGAFPHSKNWIKKTFNVKPDLRVFLNSQVKEGFDFQDNIKYCYRDMGVDDIFFHRSSGNKEYDFVYIGSITKARKIPTLLRYFKNENKKRSILLIGDVPDEIHQEFSGISNIHFSGRVPYEEVPKYATKARFGINYIPDQYPFNLQTSTKLLEYLAMGLDVITTDYKWVRTFMEKNEIQLITVDERLSNLEQQLTSYQSPVTSSLNMERYLWDGIIKQSGIEEQLIKIL
ncbi:glycosyltransferase [Fictibacillus sp. UD]|uniref:glycosyltransferase n=1 Tax=Fictibacillus sp. UD TaxID=3038777 RepID=UPI0037454AF8